MYVNLRQTRSQAEAPPHARSATAVVWPPPHVRRAWRDLMFRLRSALSGRSGWRYAQIIPVGLLLWALDDADRFRVGAASAGMRNAVVVDAISRKLGGWVAGPMNDWLANHPGAGAAAAWYYIVLQGAIVGVVGIALIWRRVPTFSFHRNALIACNLIGLIAFWLYPVAPPRMLPGQHDITATSVPVFSAMLEGKAAGLFASLPSLHVTWALWVAVALTVLVRHPLARALIWLYPVATVLDVLATANHYMLDVVTAPGALVLAYALAWIPVLIQQRRMQAARRRIGDGRIC